MTCVKKHVECRVQCIDGYLYYGNNGCKNPQKTCPREPGDDYTKCKTVCGQSGHAEEMALKSAYEQGADLSNGTAYLRGINHYCKTCQQKLYRAGIRTLRFEE